MISLATLNTIVIQRRDLHVEVAVVNSEWEFEWLRPLKMQDDPIRLYKAFQRARSPVECAIMRDAWLQGGGALDQLLDELGINLEVGEPGG